MRQGRLPVLIIRVRRTYSCPPPASNIYVTQICILNNEKCKYYTKHLNNKQLTIISYSKEPGWTTFCSFGFSGIILFPPPLRSFY